VLRLLRLAARVGALGHDACDRAAGPDRAEPWTGERAREALRSTAAAGFVLTRNDQQVGVVDCVFDLVGNRVLRDSLRVVRPRGRVCQLGFLGGLEPVTGFNPIADLPSGVQFSFYGSAFVLGTSEFPLTEIPLTEMIGKAESGLYQAKPARVFGFDDIVEAHKVMESGLAGGKMTVSVT
jgi:NADPH2:quinone reductase